MALRECPTEHELHAYVRVGISAAVVLGQYS